MAELLTTRVEDRGDATWVCAAGEIDLASVDRLAGDTSAAVAATRGSLVLDLTGITFMGSAGISYLVNTWIDCGHQGVRLTVHPSRRVSEVMETAGLAEVLEPGSMPPPPQ